MLLDAGAQGIAEQDDAYGSTSAGTRAEAPRQTYLFGGMDVPLDPDPRVVLFELSSQERRQTERDSET